MSGCAIDGERESVLRGQDPLSAPSANDCIEPSRHLIAKGPSSADRQLPNAAGMQDVGGIVAAVGVVSGQAKPSQRRRSVELVLREAQNILVITLADRTGVVCQYTQAMRESAFVSDLHRLVVCGSLSGQVIAVLAKIRERQVWRYGRSGWKDRGR